MTGRLRGGAVAVAAVLVALVLAACAGLPLSGPVNPGRSMDDEASIPDFSFVPDSPTPGASPQQIVEGFIAAGSGPRRNWETAQEYLAPEFRAHWRPRAGVIVDVPGDRAYRETAPDAVTLTVRPEATVDGAGAYSVAGSADMQLGFRLAQQADGEWRIIEAPDGIVLDRNRFHSVFRSYSLMYFDPTWTYLVPDQRWFPVTNPATYVAEALIDGAPSPWLAASVATAFPEQLELAQQAVPVRSGIAQVSLSDTALEIEPETLARMQTQLEESLASVGIPAAQLLVDDQALSAAAVPVRSTRVDARPLVLTEAGFGFLSGDTLEPIPGLSDAVLTVPVAAAQVSASRTIAALLDIDGTVLRAESNETVRVLDSRPGMVAPTLDPAGFVWTAPGGDPASVVAYAPDGTPHPIAQAWPGATRIAAMQVSRDGTRMAALVRDGTRPAMWIAGVVRDGDGTPVALGEPVLLTELEGDGIALGWLDAATVAAVVGDGDQRYVHDQPVGGLGSTTTAPLDAVDLAGGNQPGMVRLRDATGGLYVQRGGSWQRLAGGVRVLASQQGTPR